MARRFRRRPAMRRAPRRRGARRSRVPRPLRHSSAIVIKRSLYCPSFYQNDGGTPTYQDGLYGPAVASDVAGGYFYGAVPVRLNDVPDYTDFTSLFQEYRISKVKATFYPRFNMDSINNGGDGIGVTAQSASLGQFMTWVDRDFYQTIPPYVSGKPHKLPDTNVLMDITLPMCLPGLRTTRTNQIMSRSWAPRLQNLVSSLQGSATYGKTTGPQWLQTGNADVIHWGLQYLITPPAQPNTTVFFDMKLDFTIQLRGPC